MEGTMVGSPTTGGSVDDSVNRFDLIFKYIIIGDTSVGKSCILHQYLRGKCKGIYVT
jgi:GTPase SAR1 family protein